MKYIIIGLCLLGASCSFKGKDESTGNSKEGSSFNNELKIDPSGDSDGDGFLDQQEVATGTNPFVADLPDLKIRFLQNYSIQVSYHDKGSKESKSFVLDTKINSNDPDFKYRVGKVFARSHALKSAASFGRFSGHSSGKIEDKDYSWINYPELDPKFFNAKR